MPSLVEKSDTCADGGQPYMSYEPNKPYMSYKPYMSNKPNKSYMSYKQPYRKTLSLNRARYSRWDACPSKGYPKQYVTNTH